MTAETCPHYLTFAAEEVPDGATAFKCCPPIRDAANRERCGRALADGTHRPAWSPTTRRARRTLKALDTGDFAAAWGGIASLQLGLPAVWTGARDRGRGLADVVRWMAAGPADLAGLRRKGRIAVGADADLCVLAPDEAFVVDAGGAAAPAPGHAVRRAHACPAWSARPGCAGAPRRPRRRSRAAGC